MIHIFASADLLTKDYNFDQKFTLTMLSSTGMVLFHRKCHWPFLLSCLVTLLFIFWPELDWSTWKLKSFALPECYMPLMLWLLHIACLLNISRMIICLVFHMLTICLWDSWLDLIWIPFLSGLSQHITNRTCYRMMLPFFFLLCLYVCVVHIYVRH